MTHIDATMLDIFGCLDIEVRPLALIVVPWSRRVSEVEATAVSDPLLRWIILEQQLLVEAILVPKTFVLFTQSKIVLVAFKILLKFIYFLLKLSVTLLKFKRLVLQGLPLKLKVLLLLL